jgi:hypothetical protein
VAVVGLTLVDAFRVRLAVPSTASVEEFVAVTVRICPAETLLGAVNTPLAEMLPTAGFSDQVTLVPEGRFTTENCWVPEGATVVVAGLTLVAGEACRFKEALPKLTWVEALEAVTVIVSAVGTLFGAVYKPLVEMLPTGGLSDQATLVSKGTFVTENCWVPEGATPTFAGVTLVVGVLTGGEDPPVGDEVVVGAGPTKMVALTDLVGSSTLVAEIVTSLSIATERGAEYSPPADMVPGP